MCRISDWGFAADRPRRSGSEQRHVATILIAPFHVSCPLRVNRSGCPPSPNKQAPYLSNPRRHRFRVTESGRTWGIFSRPLPMPAQPEESARSERTDRTRIVVQSPATALIPSPARSPGGGHRPATIYGAPGSFRYATFCPGTRPGCNPLRGQLEAWREEPYRAAGGIFRHIPCNPRDLHNPIALATQRDGATSPWPRTKRRPGKVMAKPPRRSPPQRPELPRRAGIAGALGDGATRHVLDLLHLQPAGRLPRGRSSRALSRPTLREQAIGSDATEPPYLIIVFILCLFGRLVRLAPDRLP